ncbi:MAG: hypothetical protein ACK52I_22380 [Pseudomonadota bacterium]
MRRGTASASALSGIRVPTLEGNPLMRVGAPPPEELFPVPWRRERAAA